jgi:hypothetical protein
MLKIEQIIDQLAANAEVIRTMAESISNEQGQWKPDAETWSIKEVLDHFYNEERLDFRRHLKEMLSTPPQPWAEFNQDEFITPESYQLALEGFLTERKSSLRWLKNLDTPDWDINSQANFGPTEVLTLHAGDILVSWVAHDFLHIRQLNELMYAWQARHASPYSVQYAGGW